VVLPSITDHMDISEGDLDYPVAFDKVPANEFHRYDLVNANVVGSLKELSNERLGKSDDFAKLTKNIKRYEDQKAKKEVPLNEEKFNARRAELDSEAEEEKTFEEQAGSNGENEVFKRNFYNNEVLGITLDYLRLLGKDKVAKANTPVAPN
jgi:carboxyl-terminal processing protease